MPAAMPALRRPVTTAPLRRHRAVMGFVLLAAATAACSPAAADGGDRAVPSAEPYGPVAQSDAGGAAVEGQVHPVTTVVVSDDSAAAGDATTSTWPGALASELAAAGTPLELTPAVDEDAGFAAEDGVSFEALVREHVVHDTQLVVFYEETVGERSPSAVADGVVDALAAVEEKAPDARAVVIGPFGHESGSDVPSEDVREALHEATSRAEVTVDYVDPFTEEWPEDLSAPDLAALLFPHVSDLVKALAESGAFE